MKDQKNSEFEMEIGMRDCSNGTRDCSNIHEMKIKSYNGLSHAQMMAPENDGPNSPDNVEDHWFENS